jgi:hypothetical protein
VFRPVIAGLLKTVEPEEVANRRQRGFRRRHFWAAGVNDVWPQDQHDKWGRFGLWLHAGIEAFSGEINWIKIWWTNKNPRLVAKFYLDTCRQIGGTFPASFLAKYPTNTIIQVFLLLLKVIQGRKIMALRTLRQLSATVSIRPLPTHCSTASPLATTTSFQKASGLSSDEIEDILDLGVNNGWYDVTNTLEK